MFKNIKKSLILIFILFLFIGIAGILGNIENTYAATCTDSDGGKDYYTYGTASTGDYITFSDACGSYNDTNFLSEVYCENGEIKTENHTCLYGCENGACKSGITVISPNGGEDLSIGDTLKIKWNHSEDIEIVDIAMRDYVAYGSYSGINIATGIDADSGSYSWIINDVSPGETYKINIIDGDYSKLAPNDSDLSDDYFSVKIADEDVLDIDFKITEVDGFDKVPEKLPYNALFTISWNAPEALSCDASGLAMPLVGGNYWMHLTNLPKSGTKQLYARHPTNGYQTPLNLGIQCWNSNWHSTIKELSVDLTAPKPTIKIISPNGKETIEAGENYEITWETENMSKINIALIKESTSWRIAYNIDASLGSYSWKVGENFEKSDDYKIKIWDVDYSGLIEDTSDAYFNVLSDVSSVLPIIKKFAGPSQLRVGEKGIWKVEIDNSRNNNLNYTIDWGDGKELYPKAILEKISNDNKILYFEHTYIQMPSGAVPIELTVSDNAGNSSNSLTTVEILPTEKPFIKITSLTHKNSWTRGIMESIEWTSSKIDKVNIEIEQDDQSWPLAYNVSASLGEYHWQVTDNFIEGDNYRIHIWDADNPEIEDRPKGYLTIQDTVDTSCSDTDNGDNKYEKGDLVCNQKKYTDYCSQSQDGMLVEYLCESGKVTSFKHNCYYGCSDGACIKKPSDKKISINIWSKVQTNEINGEHIRFFSDYHDQSTQCEFSFISPDGFIIGQGSGGCYDNGSGFKMASPSHLKDDAERFGIKYLGNWIFKIYLPKYDQIVETEFTVTEGNVSIKVLGPNGSEKLIKNFKTVIEWQANGASKYWVSLFKGGIFLKHLAKDLENTSYTWIPGEDIKVAHNYKIRIMDPSTGAYDKSDNYFSIIQMDKNTCLPDGTLIKLPNNPKIYVIQNCKRKWIRTQEEFKKEGYKWEDVQETSSDIVNAYVEYLETQAKLLRAIGQNKVYRIIGNKRLWVPTISAFNAQGLKWEGIEDKAETEVNQYSRVKLLKDKNKEGIYYITESGLRRQVPNNEVFNSYGNKWEDVVEVDKEIIESYEVCNLIKPENSYQIYKLEGNIKHWIKTADAFNRLKYNWSNVAPVNETELNAYQEGDAIE